MSGSESGIKVAVRVRPFNAGELASAASCVVRMTPTTTSLLHPDSSVPPRNFTFDHSYWSHDGFIAQSDGIFVPAPLASKAKASSSQPASSSTYCDQRQVYSDLGVGVLNNAFQGYNASLFAYGQTGSGKSYSILGYGPNRGIVPMFCNDIFARIDANKDADVQYQMTFSMLEIYNERVRDLLRSDGGPISAPARQSRSTPALAAGVNTLVVRQHPKTGFFVDGLSQVAVSSYAEIERCMTHGTLNRTTASTLMNETSSRSHMLITIKFKQIINRRGQSTTITSDINLVDLAGSERSDTAGTSGDRLKEGSAINLSLTTLGQVISALADKAIGKAGVIVPYRDSVLTKLLHNALGGNSKTVMIAAISPALSSYDETLSTLRYAERVKRIQNKAIVNESPTDRLIRELKEENSRLQKLMSQRGGSDSVEMETIIAANTRELESLNQSWEVKLKEARQAWEAEVAWQRGSTSLEHGPYLTNLNEDPQLSGVIKHLLPEGRTLIGRAESKARPSTASGRAFDFFVKLPGVSIQEEHCVLTRRGDEVSLKPISSSAHIFVSGAMISTSVILKHNDRVVLSPTHLFVFVAALPIRRRESQVKVDFDSAQRELANAKGLSSLMNSSWVAQDPVIRLLREDLINLMPMISEANAISEELGKSVLFEIVVQSGASHDLLDRSKVAMVKVTDRSQGLVWLWSKAKFVNRKYLMQEVYQSWSAGEALDGDRGRDPFWDPPEDYFLGSSYIYLQSLAYQIEADEVLAVTNYHGNEEGTLFVSLVPCDSTGSRLRDEECADKPSDLLSKRLDFWVNISSARGIKWVSENPKRGVQCRYKFYNDTQKRATDAIVGSANPEFNYSRQFTIPCVVQPILDYFDQNALIIELWGTPGIDAHVSKQTTLLNSRPSKLQSTARTKTMPHISISEDQAMDSILNEAAWLKEKRDLQAKLENVQQELAMARIEPSTALSVPSEPASSESDGMCASLQDFAQNDAAIRAKIRHLREVGVTKSDAQGLQIMLDAQRTLSKVLQQSLAKSLERLQTEIGTLPKPKK
eukprot:m.411086 g.411086  ORF g.411086 m.411086 type:complete len:1043 (-) comp56548_c0_seq3:106-3234(-)